SNSA
ncbi:hypothetical protein TSUD_166660, partial [Trifolium subterraneum]